MDIKRSKKLTGFLVFALGIGILLAVCVPAIGWLVLSALGLICIGLYLLKC